MESKKEARYIQIYQHLKEGIIRGDFPCGTKLPSRNNMAEEMQVSVITIKHAYELLCDEGYVESKERSGYYVIFRKDDGFIATAATPNLLKKVPQIQEDETFPLGILTRTMRRVMNDYGEFILQKSSNKGCLEFRETICRYLSRNRGIHATPEQIVIGSGSEYLYHLIVGIFGKDTVIALESPSYPRIQQVYEMATVECEMLPLAHDGIDSQSLKTSRASVLHISPYRSFPSGITASASKKYEYVRWAERPNHYIIEDDFESEFSLSRKPEETIYTLTSHDNVIYMNSFSKSISPSLRVAYMVLPKKLVEVYDKKMGFYACTVPTFEQLVIHELIQNGDFERHLNRIRRKKRKEMR